MGTFGCVRYPTTCARVSSLCEYNTKQQRRTCLENLSASQCDEIFPDYISDFSIVLLLSLSDMRTARWEMSTSTLRKPGSTGKFYK